MPSTTPQPSCPSPPGSVGNFIHSGPAQGPRFEAQTPQPSSRMRTCPGPGSGNAVSSMRMVPAPVTTAARMVRAGASVAVMCPPSALLVACHELVEAALAFSLVEEGEVVVVEHLEELVPGYFFERVFRLAEVDAQDAAFFLLTGPHHCWS